MAKSKDKKTIEQLTKERNHWRNKAQEYKRENERLKLFNQVNQASASAGAQVIDKTIEQLQIERDDLLQALADMQNDKLSTVFDGVIPEIYFEKPLADDATRVFLMYCARDNKRLSNGLQPSTFHTMVLPDLKTSIEQVETFFPVALHRFIATHLQIPLPTDFKHKPFYRDHIEPYTDIEESELIKLFVTILSARTNGQEEEAHNTWRDYLWRMCNQHPDYAHTRTKFVDDFGKFVSRTMKNAEFEHRRLLAD